MSCPLHPSAPPPPETARPTQGGRSTAAPYESDLGLDLAPLQRELARHVKSNSRVRPRASHPPPRPGTDKLHFPSAADTPILTARSLESVVMHPSSPPLSSRGADSVTGSDTETDGESEAYEHVPHYELQAMLREAKRVIKQRERDLELAARIGTALVNRNLNLTGHTSHPHLCSTSSFSHAHHSSVGEAGRYPHRPHHSHSHSHPFPPRHSNTLSDVFDPPSPLPSPLVHSSVAGQDNHLHRASALSTDSINSLDLPAHDYFGSLGRSSNSADGHRHGAGHHGRSVSDLTGIFSEQCSIGRPRVGNDALVSLPPRVGRDPLDRMPEHASIQFDDNEVVRAHAREMETQRRLASLMEENSVLLERLTQLQSETERNHRDGGRKLRSLDHELQQLRDELDAVMERNAELECESKARLSFEKHSPSTPDQPERAHRWHHRPLLASLGSLHDLEGRLSLVHSPPKKHTQTDAPPLSTGDGVEASETTPDTTPVVPNVPLKHQGEKNFEDEASNDPVAANEGLSSVAVELQEAAHRKLLQGKKQHSSRTPDTSNASHIQHNSHTNEVRVNQAEMDSLVKRLLAKIDELEQTSLQMTREGFDMDGRLGQAIEANERLRDAYGAIGEGRESSDLARPGSFGGLSSEELRSRPGSERGAGTRYTIAAHRLANDVFGTGIDAASSIRDDQAPPSEAGSEVVAHSGTFSIAPHDDEMGDRTMEVMDLLQELEELRLGPTAGLAAIQENDASNSAEPEEWQAEAEDTISLEEAEDDIALVEAGDGPRRATAEDAEDEESSQQDSTENHLRSLLHQGEGNWADDKQILPLGALREPTVGTTADGYEMITEATKRLPLLWADDEDYGKPITLQQAADYGLVNFSGSPGLVESGWMIFVALRRALGLLPYAERKRVSSTARSRDLGRVLATSPNTPRLRIQSTDQLEAEAELRRILHQRRIEFEEAVRKMRRRSSSSAAALSSLGGRTRSSTMTSPSTVAAPQHESGTLSLPQNLKYGGDNGWGKGIALNSCVGETIEVADLPNCQGRPNTSLSYASTEWLVDPATDRMYVKMPKPKSRDVLGAEKERPLSSLPTSTGVGQEKSLLHRAVSDPQAIVASAKAKVDSASNEVATVVSTWAAFTSIVLCAGVYMFSHGPRRVLSNATEPSS